MFGRNQIIACLLAALASVLNSAKSEPNYTIKRHWLRRRFIDAEFQRGRWLVDDLEAVAPVEVLDVVPDAVLGAVQDVGGDWDYRAVS